MADKAVESSMSEKHDVSISEVLERSSSDSTHADHLEFHAKIIPYDTCEDPNSPILAYSGANINLIFSISNESFRNLAFAAIDHLGHDSDFKTLRYSDSTSNEQTSKFHQPSKASAMSSLTTVHGLDAGNATIVGNASEDIDESENSNNRDLQINKESCEYFSPLTDKTGARNYSSCNGSEVLDNVSVSNDYEIESQTRSSELSFHIKESLNNLQSTFSVPKKTFDSSKQELPKYPDSTLCLSVDEECGEPRNSKVVGITNVIDNVQLENDAPLNDAKVECGKDESGKIREERCGIGAGDHGQDVASNEIQNIECLTSGKKIDHVNEIDLSAHNLDVSIEDCPELENVWPDIYPFAETEKIPVKEMKSFELNGVVTKYLKLEFLKDLVVIRVTSDSIVHLDAVKYKEAKTDSKTEVERSSEDSNLAYKSISLPEKKPTDSFTIEGCTKSIPSTTLHNLHEDSRGESSDFSEINESLIGGHDDKHSYVSEEATEEKIVPEFVDKKETVRTDSLEPQILEIESEGPNSSTQTLNKSSSNLGTESLDKNLKSLEFGFEIKPNLTLNSSSICLESKLAYETKECETPDKEFENMQLKKILSLNIEQKLEESDIKVPGNSPTERLRFTLNDSLRNESVCSKIEAQKSVSNVHEKNSNKRTIGDCLTETSNENDFQTRGECFKETSSEDVSNISNGCPDYEKEVQFSHRTKSSPDNASLNIEFDRCHGLKCNILPGNQFKDSSLNEDKESTDNINVDYTAIEDPIPKENYSPSENSLYNVSISLEETNLKKESDSLNFKENSSESSFSETLRSSPSRYLIDTCSKVENADESKIDSPENIACIQSNMQENGSSDYVVNMKTPSKGAVHVQNEMAEDAKTPDNVTLRKMPVKNSEFKQTENSFKSIAEDKLSKDISIEDASDVPEETLEDKLCTDKIVRNKVKNSEGCGEPVKTDLVENVDASQYSAEKRLENEQLNNSELNDSSDEINDIGEVETKDTVEESLENQKFGTGKNESSFNDSPHSVEHEANGVCNSEDYSVDHESMNETLKSPENEPSEEISECIENDLDSNTSGDTEIKLPENSFASNGEDSLMDKTVDNNAESMSEGGDLESDDVKSVESDDSKDSEKRGSVHKRRKNGKYVSDEVDCAPTRVRRRKVISALSKDAIPEHTETTSKVRSTLNITSKSSGRLSPIASRALRSKSLDPSPQQSKEIANGQKQNTVQSEEMNRKKRATTPDIIGKKDLKTTLRSSPRKLVRSSATESKVPSTKTSAADAHSKSRANLDSSTSKRSKRGNKD